MPLTKQGDELVHAVTYDGRDEAEPKGLRFAAPENLIISQATAPAYSQPPLLADERYFRKAQPNELRHPWEK